MNTMKILFFLALVASACTIFGQSWLKINDHVYRKNHLKGQLIFWSTDDSGNPRFYSQAPPDTLVTAIFSFINEPLSMQQKATQLSTLKAEHERFRQALNQTASFSANRR
ncbi:hypothetical protein JW998_10610 [candidate division KSB1 bacterium]|nr:hypothetical protein [candidate division KSB1 bacterium]